MTISDPSLPAEEFSDFQLHKIYIKDLVSSRPPADAEAMLLGYFSHYGQIIDLKVLQTSRFISNQEDVRLRNF
jgi:hypothetical protein